MHTSPPLNIQFKHLTPVACCMQLPSISMLMPRFAHYIQSLSERHPFSFMAAEAGGNILEAPFAQSTQYNAVQYIVPPEIITLKSLSILSDFHMIFCIISNACVIKSFSIRWTINLAGKKLQWQYKRRLFFFSLFRMRNYFHYSWLRRQVLNEAFRVLGKLFCSL